MAALDGPPQGDENAAVEHDGRGGEGLLFEAIRLDQRHGGHKNIVELLKSGTYQPDDSEWRALEDTAIGSEMQSEALKKRNQLRRAFIRYKEYRRQGLKPAQIVPRLVREFGLDEEDVWRYVVLAKKKKFTADRTRERSQSDILPPLGVGDSATRSG